MYNKNIQLPDAVAVDDLISNEDDNFWSSYDLGISAALLSQGFQLVSLDKEDPRKVQFIFRKAEGMEKAIELYFQNKLKVRARTYFENVKAIKNRLYSGDSYITK